MSFTIAATDQLNFQMIKEGGAKMTMRIAIFQNPQTPTQKRVRLLFMGGAKSKTEMKTLDPLPKGSYQLVAVCVIEEAVSGAYQYEADLNGHQFAKKKDDVNQSAALDIDTVVHRQNVTVI